MNLLKQFVNFTFLIGQLNKSAKIQRQRLMFAPAVNLCIINHYLTSRIQDNMKQSSAVASSNISQESSEEQNIPKLPLTMGMPDLVIEDDDEHLESPLPQSCAHKNRQTTKLSSKLDTGLIICENVDTESPAKLLRLQKQMISPQADYQENSLNEEDVDEPPSRNTKNELMVKLRNLTGTQDGKNNQSFQSKQSKKPELSAKSSKRISQSMRASPREMTSTLKKKKTGAYKSMLDASDTKKESQVSKSRHHTSCEVDKGPSAKQKVNDRIENYCKSSFSSQTVSGNIQIRDDMDDDGEQLIMESDSEKEDEMSGPLELDAISEKPQKLESTIKKKNLQHSAPPVKEPDLGLENTQDQPRFELGGEVCYDSQAHLIGCTKIVKYFEETKDDPARRTDPYILFGQDEVKEALRETGVGEKAKDRDFNTDQERTIFRNLPRFQHCRNFKNFKYKQFVQEQKNVLIFDSRFENGNLRKACKVSNIEYNLWLENDSNTKGHTQWYYFKVTYKDIASRAEKKTHKIKFNILNLAKTTSLYQIGMKPVIYSQNKKNDQGVGWFRGGEDISYKQNSLPRTHQIFNGENNQGMSTARKIESQFFQSNTFLQNKNGLGEGTDTYFTLSFTYEFEANRDDVVWFSHAIPFTFTEMSEQLKSYRENEKYEQIFRAELMCLSLGRLPVPMLTVTDNVQSYLSFADEMRVQQQMPGIVKRSLRQKYRGVVKLMKQAQQMRGKSTDLLRSAVEEEITQFYQYNEDQLLNANLSFAGFGQRLLSYVKDHAVKKAIVITARVHPGEPQASHMLTGLLRYLTSPEAAPLRHHFVFRIIPMLNPDGVVYGNYRCSLLGCDLNRKWDRANRLLHPTIFYSKTILRNFSSERKILMFCDLHGHSRKQNAFFYGCMFRNYEHDGRVKNAQLRIIPLMCCQKNDLFQLKGCNFNMNKSKEATARMTVFREFSVMLSYTIECSFFGKLTKDGKLLHMQLEDYQSLGETVLKTIHHYLPSQIPKLQFFTGKVLKVFHDQFIKLVPEHIIRREMDRMKQAEEQKALKEKQKRDALKKRQKSFVSQSLQRKTTKDVAQFALEFKEQDQATEKRGNVDDVMLNISQINDQDDAETPMIIDDDEDTENLTAILQQYQLNLGTVLGLADSDTSPINQDFGYIKPSGGSTSEEKGDFSNRSGYNTHKEEWQDFEAFIERINQKKGKIEGESGDESSSSADESPLETKKKMKRKKPKFSVQNRKKESESSVLQHVLQRGGTLKQAELSSAKPKGQHLRSKTLALHQKIPSFSRKMNNNSGQQVAMTSQNFAKEKAIATPSSNINAGAQSILTSQQTGSFIVQNTQNGNPPPSPSVLSSIISPRRTTGLSDGALAMPILRKKRMRQGTQGQLSSQAQGPVPDSAEATPEGVIGAEASSSFNQPLNLISQNKSLISQIEIAQQRVLQSGMKPNTPPLPDESMLQQAEQPQMSFHMPQETSQKRNPKRHFSVNQDLPTPNFQEVSNIDKKVNYVAALLQSQQLNKQTLNVIKNMSETQKRQVNEMMKSKAQPKPLQLSESDQQAINNIKAIKQQNAQHREKRNSSMGVTRDINAAKTVPQQTPEKGNFLNIDSKQSDVMKSGQISMRGSPSFALPEIQSNSKAQLTNDRTSKLGSFEKSKNSMPESRLRQPSMNDHGYEHRTEYKQPKAHIHLRGKDGKSLDFSSSDSVIEVSNNPPASNTDSKRRNYKGLLSQQPTPLAHFSVKKDTGESVPTPQTFNVQATNEKTILKADQVNFNNQGSLSVGKKVGRAEPAARLENAFMNRKNVFTSPSIEGDLRMDESTEIIRKQQQNFHKLQSTSNQKSDINNALALGNVTDYLNTQLNFNPLDHSREKSHDEVQIMSPQLVIKNSNIASSDYDKPKSNQLKSRQILRNAKMMTHANRQVLLTEQTQEYDTSQSLSLHKVNQRRFNKEMQDLEMSNEKNIMSGPVSRLKNTQDVTKSNYRHMSLSNMAEMESQENYKQQKLNQLKATPWKKEQQDVAKSTGGKQLNNSVIMQLVQDGQFQLVNKGQYLMQSPAAEVNKSIGSGSKRAMHQIKKDQTGISYGSQDIDQMKQQSEFPDLNATSQMIDEAISRHHRINSMQNQNQAGLQNFRQQLRMESNQNQPSIQHEVMYPAHVIQDKINQKRQGQQVMFGNELFGSPQIMQHQALANNQQLLSHLPQVNQMGGGMLSAKQWRHASVSDSLSVQQNQYQTQKGQRLQSNDPQRNAADLNKQFEAQFKSTSNPSNYAHVVPSNQPMRQTTTGFFGQNHEKNFSRPSNYDSNSKGQKGGGGLRTHEMKRGYKVQELQQEIVNNQTLSGRRSPDLLQANQQQINQPLHSAGKQFTRKVLQDFAVPSHQNTCDGQSSQNYTEEIAPILKVKAPKKNIGQSKRRQIIQEQMASEMLQRQKELQLQLHEHTALLKSLHDQLSASKRQGYDGM